MNDDADAADDTNDDRTTYNNDDNDAGAGVARAEHGGDMTKAGVVGDGVRRLC